MLHVSGRALLQNIKSPRWLSPPTSQIWCPVTSGFSPNLNHLWKRGNFRPSVRFREIQWGSWWHQQRICSVLNSGKDARRTAWGPKVSTLKGSGVSLSYVQCFLYLVSSSINVSIFHSIWVSTFWTELVCLDSQILLCYNCLFSIVTIQVCILGAKSYTI